MDELNLRRDRGLLGTRLAELILDQIRAAELADGDPLPSERELADEYGASLRVVRDALRLLSQQGAIRTQQGRRAVVSALRPVGVENYFRMAMGADSEAIHDFLEFRSVLETRAAGFAATRATDQELDRLAAVLDEIEAVGPQERLHRADLDVAFHLGIIRSSKNHFLNAVAEALTDVLSSERRDNLARTESAGRTHDVSDAEHRAIYQALRDHDAGQAERLMREHLDRAQRTLRELSESAATSAPQPAAGHTEARGADPPASTAISPRAATSAARWTTDAAAAAQRKAKA